MFSVIERLTKEKGVTLYQVSKDTGISPGNISDWKSGRSNPSVCALVRLAQYFGVSLETFTDADARKGANK